MGVTTDSKSDSSQHVNSTAPAPATSPKQHRKYSLNVPSCSDLLLLLVVVGESENIGSVSICCLPAVFTTTTTATITYLSIHNQLTPKNAAEETKTFPSPRLKYSWCAVRHCSTDWQWCNSIITYLHVT